MEREKRKVKRKTGRYKIKMIGEKRKMARMREETKKGRYKKI